MSDNEKTQVGREITDCLDAIQQALHVILGEMSRTMPLSQVDAARIALEAAELKIMKLKLRF